VRSERVRRRRKNERGRTKSGKEGRKRGAERKIRDTSDHRHGDGQLLALCSLFLGREESSEQDRKAEGEKERKS